MQDKAEEKKIGNTTIGYEMSPLEAAAVNNYTLFKLEKIYVNIEFLVKTDKQSAGTDKHMAGFNFVSPEDDDEDHIVYIAVPTDDSIIENLPARVIHIDSFDRQFERLADSVLAYRKRILDAGKTDGF